jgi:hypothetical protein
MCLTELERFEPAKKGWQVKRKICGLKNTYMSIFYGSEMQELGETYHACEEPVLTESYSFFKHPDGRKTYWTGFHVFHSLDDAINYRASRSGPPNEHCIVQVECSGKKTTGWQVFEYIATLRRSMRKVRAKVTVCQTIKILKEISFEEK